VIIVPWLIILWTQGSIDIINLSKINAIRMYRNQGRFSVTITTDDRIKISFDFYNDEEISKLPSMLKHAESTNSDIIIVLKDQKIFESKRGLLLKLNNSGR